MQKQNRGFTIIELLVVIIVISIFAFIAYPNISSWTTDRKVKKEVYDFVNYFEEKKSEVQFGKYGVLVIGQTSPEQNKSYNWYLTPEDLGTRNKISKMRECPGNPDSDSSANWIKDSAGAFQWSNKVYTWENKKYCVSKDAIMFPGELEFNVTSTEKASFLVCSRTNTTNSGGSNPCNYRNENDFRYAVQIDRSLNLKVYKYNLKEDAWRLQ